MKKVFFFLFPVFLFLFLLPKPTAYANQYNATNIDTGSNATLDVYGIGLGACASLIDPGWYTTDLAACDLFIGSPNNVCCQPGDTTCTTWQFTYASGCQFRLSNPDTGDCGSQFTYSYNNCNVEDRCWGSNLGASGYDSEGRILAGQCSASSYDGSDPNSACISGGHYKQCCSDPSPGYIPTTACSNGLCPSGFKTDAGTTSCQTPPSSTCDGCTYSETCTTSTGTGTHTCNGKKDSAGTCKYDSGCTPDCGTCSTCDGTTYSELCNSGTGVHTCNGKNYTYDANCAPNCDTCVTKYKCSGTSCVADGGGTYTSSTCNDACNPSCTYSVWSAWSNVGCNAGGCSGLTPMQQKRTRTVINGTNCTATSDYRCVADSSCSGGGSCGGAGQPACCDSNQLTMTASPNPATMPSNITFSLSGSQGSTYIGDSWSGGTNCSGDFWGSKTCAATSVGAFSWTHTWKNCAPGNCAITSTQCSKSLDYTINANQPPTPTISTSLSCIPNGYNESGFTIAWGSSTPPVTWVDISASNSFSPLFFNKPVSTSNTTAPAGFSLSTDSSIGLTLIPSTPYYTRLWNGTHSNTATFTTPPLCITILPWIQVVGGDVHSNGTINAPGGP